MKLLINSFLALMLFWQGLAYATSGPTNPSPAPAPTQYSTSGESSSKSAGFVLGVIVTAILAFIVCLIWGNCGDSDPEPISIGGALVPDTANDPTTLYGVDIKRK